MDALSRRTILRVAALAATSAACAPAAATRPPEPIATPEPAPSPRPTAAPTQAPTPVREATSTPAGAEATPTAAPPAERVASPTPAHETAWRAEWEAVVAAAKAEGTVSLLTWGDTWGGVGYGRVVERFEQAFPGVVVDRLSESSASVWLGKVRQGRRVGVYAFDLALVQPDAALTQGRPDGIWAPIKPLLVHPDALADGAWRDGLNARFLDAAGDLCFAWEHQVLHAYAINTDLAQAGEIATVKDLLDRKWAGKVISSDPRLGIGLFSAASVAKTWGVEVVKQLLVDQRPTFSAGGRHLAEALVRGRFPVALGVRPKALAPFRDEGLDRKVAFLDLPDADFAATTAMLYFDRAPHPAAAKLFANWILTREGQTVLTSSLPTNSARTDVDAFEPTGVGTAGKRYYEPDREANYRHTAATRAFIHGLPGGISLIGAA